jgi:hypothetical protein
MLQEVMKAEEQAAQSHFVQRFSKLNDRWTLLFISLAIVAFLLSADTLIEHRPFAPRTFWALFDVFVHGVVALIVVLPVLGVRLETPMSILPLLAALFAATWLDLDHFIAAGSLNIEDALSLATRPATHSLTFAGLVGIVSTLSSRKPVLGWVMFAALASHVLRDAAGGITLVLWPLPVTGIPWWSYYLAEITLFHISFLMRRRGWTA